MDEISNTIQKATTSLSASYAKIAEMGGELPEDKNSNNLAAAIRSIPVGPTITPPDLRSLSRRSE